MEWILTELPEIYSLKFTLRNPIGFAIVSVASVITLVYDGGKFLNRMLQRWK
jgi:hypothetical protein